MTKAHLVSIGTPNDLGMKRFKSTEGTANGILSTK